MHTHAHTHVKFIILSDIHNAHLEGEVHADEEGECGRGEDALLVQRVLHLLQLHHLLLVQDLHRVVRARLHHRAARRRGAPVATTQGRGKYIEYTALSEHLHRSGIVCGTRRDEVEGLLNSWD